MYVHLFSRHYNMFTYIDVYIYIYIERERDTHTESWKGGGDEDLIVLCDYMIILYVIFMYYISCVYYICIFPAVGRGGGYGWKAPDILIYASIC